MARETNRGRLPGEGPATALPVEVLGGAVAWAGRVAVAWVAPVAGTVAWAGPLGPRWPAPRAARWPGPRGRGAGGGDHDLPRHAALGVGGQVADVDVGAGGGEGEAGVPGGPRGDVRGTQVEGLDDEVVLPGAGVAEDEVDRPDGGGELIRGEEVGVAPLAHLHRDGLPLGPGGGRRQEGAAEGEGATGQDAEPESGGQEMAWCQLVPLRCGLWDRVLRSSRHGARGTDHAAAGSRAGLVRQGSAPAWRAGTIYVNSAAGEMCREAQAAATRPGRGRGGTRRGPRRVPAAAGLGGRHRFERLDAGRLPPQPRPAHRGAPGEDGPPDDVTQGHRPPEVRVAAAVAVVPQDEDAALGHPPRAPDVAREVAHVGLLEGVARRSRPGRGPRRAPHRGARRRA